MAERNTAAAVAERPLLRRVLSFREPLLVIPYLLHFLATTASAFVRAHSSLVHSLARALPLAPKHAYSTASSSAGDSDDDGDDLSAAGGDGGAAAGPEEEAAAAEESDDDQDDLSKEEVEAILASMGLEAEGPAAAVGRDEVSRLFDAEEPSFEEVRTAFEVFDGDRDGLIGAEDLRAALAGLGVRQDAAACRAMIAAAGGGRDAGMSLFQFVRFLENGLC